MTTFTGHLTDAQAQRLVDGVLSTAEAPEVERHAAACLECQALVESYRMLEGALDALAEPELPDDFTFGVLARALRIGAGFVPAVVGALRLQIVLAAAAFALPLLLALARLMPAPRPESA